MNHHDNSERRLARKSPIMSVVFLVCCGFSVNGLSVFISAIPAQAQATAQDIQKVGSKVCSVMADRSKPDRQTLLVMTNVLDEDLADLNPISLALNRYVLKNCPKDYLVYQQRKRQNNPYKKNPLIIKTGVPLIIKNSATESAESEQSR